MSIREKLEAAWLTAHGQKANESLWFDKHGQRLAAGRFTRLLDAEAWLDAIHMLDDTWEDMEVHRPIEDYDLWSVYLSPGRRGGEGASYEEALLAAIEKARTV